MRLFLVPAAIAACVLSVGVAAAGVQGPKKTLGAKAAGQVGIHGTDNPGAIGRDVSHGCLRLAANAVVARLARRLPLGTPVAIVR
jgi:lipoprotein-anchoring transpeptidase ErfK/SrfK